MKITASTSPWNYFGDGWTCNTRPKAGWKNLAGKQAKVWEETLMVEVTLFMSLLKMIVKVYVTQHNPKLTDCS